jgi:hypothetical protein
MDSEIESVVGVVPNCNYLRFETTLGGRSSSSFAGSFSYKDVKDRDVRQAVKSCYPPSNAIS